jgi:hypothetical protein
MSELHPTTDIVGPPAPCPKCADFVAKVGTLVNAVGTMPDAVLGMIARDDIAPGVYWSV